MAFGAGAPGRPLRKPPSRVVRERGEQTWGGPRGEERSHLVVPHGEESHALCLEPVAVAHRPEAPREREGDVRIGGPNLVRDGLTERLPPSGDFELDRDERVARERDEVRPSAADLELLDGPVPQRLEVPDEGAPKLRLAHGAATGVRGLTSVAWGSESGKPNIAPSVAPAVGEFLTLDSFDLTGKTVLVRVDINSPLDPRTRRILSDARIREHLVTFRDLRHARVAVLAHQGRPGKDDCVPLESHAERMSALLGRPVTYVDSLIGKTARDSIKNLQDGDVILLENTRFYSEEEAFAEKPVEAMAKSHIVQRLAPLAQYFVLDAFAAAHRAQPTLVGFCEALPTLAGRVVEREVTMLDRAIASEGRPKLAILGGIKADDSLMVARHMLEKGIVDRVLTTGAVALMFLQAQGLELGKPTMAVLEKEVDGYSEQVEGAKALLAKFGDRVKVPRDVALNVDGKRVEAPVRELPADHAIADIGLETIGHFATEIAGAKTVFMNGPAGVFEIEPFAVGTRELFRVVAGSGAFTVIGGGHTVAVAEALGLQDKFNHVSTGGGALMYYLAGKPLPLLDALRRSKAKYGKVA